MAESDNTRPSGGIKIINAALFRMGTKSMAEAYKILGYNPHHGIYDPFNVPWDLLGEAAELKWPRVVGKKGSGRACGRSHWDAVWGDCDVVTDVGSPFAVDMFKAYPDAKVVVVQRKFETWWPSFVSECLDWRFFPGADLATYIFALFGMTSGNALAKMYLGMFDAANVDEIHQNARKTYDRYFQEVRQAVPADRRLEYKLGDGWEPLCAFLGKDVPDVPFPHVNDKVEHKETAQKHTRVLLMRILRQIAPWVIGLLAILVWLVAF